MPSSSLLGSRRPAGVTGTHRGQCAWAAWTVLLLMVSAAAKAAPTTPEPTSTDNVNVTAVATPVATAEVNSTGGSGGGSETGFSCEGRIFGYYGDPGNCSLFHYCEPFADPENNQFVLHAAYLCPNDTVFNQLSLTCAYAHEALPCRRAPEYYYINSHVVPADSSQDGTQVGASDHGCVGLVRCCYVASAARLCRKDSAQAAYCDYVGKVRASW
ncbi:hypothetical protein HPB51_017582 [Rhipicephalus microplus]|uniref:Chitin-binding type-2 domain-containing protein n=1 Tax=Rhipicephalus microplus TaxID=6941 RepID=A0A9J6F4P0_RHIMP|nr:hypothetical protein HPB51_017582 [Rhipicephalus microplus]